MIHLNITQDVVILTYREIGFPLETDIPEEKIKIINPKETNRIKESVRSKLIKLAIIDGTMPMDTVIVACSAIRDVRRSLQINIIICIVNQEQMIIEGTFWEKDPKNTNKYLMAA